MSGSTHKTEEHRCPACGVISNAAANLSSHRKPKNGDVSFCAHCGNWGVFDEDADIRRPTDIELLEISNNEECNQVQDLWNKTMFPGGAGSHLFGGDDEEND